MRVLALCGALLVVTGPCRTHAEGAPKSAADRATASAPARSQPGEATAFPPASPPEEASDRVDAEREGRVKRRARDLELTVKGRIYLDLAMDERLGWDRQLALGSARVALEGRVHGLLTVLEAEFASRSLVRDAYARLDGPLSTRLHAGRFKAPFSSRELESSWKLPLVARGVVNDYVVERNGLGGRQVGAMASARPWSGRLAVEAGVFTAPPAAANERTREDLAAAVFLRPEGWIEFGVTGYRANAVDDRRHAETAHLRVDAGPLLATVEAMSGLLREGPFLAGTALASWEEPLGPVWRAGPVIGFEGLRLRDGSDATGWAATAGAVLHHREGLKVKLEGECARRPGDATARNAVLVQLGARF